jgi:hypothetical protein
LAILYGLLIAPWPGWRSTYGRFFRGMSEAALGRENGKSIVRVRPAENPPRTEIDTQIVYIRRAAITPEGSAPAQILGIDSRGVGWVPTALLIALAGASPLPWLRRASALLLGILLVNGYVVFAVAVYLWNESAGMAPFSLLPYWPALGNFLEQTFMVQIGPSFAAPVLIWLLATTVAGGWHSLLAAFAKPTGN